MCQAVYGSMLFMAIVHHHLIYQASIGSNDLNKNAEKTLEKFLYDLVKEIDMRILIPPQLKFSHQKAWSGLIGIVTSHISFHYWTIEQYVQLDIYSCKKFDKEKTIAFCNKFWEAKNTKILFIDREVGKDFHIQKISQP